MLPYQMQQAMAGCCRSVVVTKSRRLLMHARHAACTPPSLQFASDESAAPITLDQAIVRWGGVASEKIDEEGKSLIYTRKQTVNLL